MHLEDEGGVVVHRRLFKDFFTFRPRAKGPRSALDLHNLSGVLALPFHALIAFSGLVIFAEMYFPFTFETTVLRAAAAFL